MVELLVVSALFVAFVYGLTLVLTKLSSALSQITSTLTALHSNSGEDLKKMHETSLAKIGEMMHLIKAGSVTEAVQATVAGDGMRAETAERLRYIQAAADAFERDRKKNGKQAEKVTNAEDPNKEYDILGV